MDRIKALRYVRERYPYFNASVANDNATHILPPLANDLGIFCCAPPSPTPQSLLAPRCLLNTVVSASSNPPVRYDIFPAADSHIYKEAERGMRRGPLAPGETWAAALPELLRHTIFMPMHGCGAPSRVLSFFDVLAAVLLGPTAVPSAAANCPWLRGEPLRTAATPRHRRPASPRRQHLGTFPHNARAWWAPETGLLWDPKLGAPVRPGGGRLELCGSGGFVPGKDIQVPHIQARGAAARGWDGRCGARADRPHRPCRRRPTPLAAPVRRPEELRRARVLHAPPERDASGAPPLPPLPSLNIPAPPPTHPPP